jgi:hypothetical protein
MGGRCPDPECNEGILNHSVDAEYAEWLTESYKQFPEWRQAAKHLEDPRPDADYPLRSEVHLDGSS